MRINKQDDGILLTLPFYRKNSLFSLVINHEIANALFTIKYGEPLWIKFPLRQNCDEGNKIFESMGQIMLECGMVIMCLKSSPE